MSVTQTASQLIQKHLDLVEDVENQDWFSRDGLKWRIITKVMNEMNNPGNCVIDQFTVSVCFDRVFYDFHRF